MKDGLMQFDHITRPIVTEISKETGVNILEVEKALDAYYKSISSSIRNGAEHIKLDHLGSFKLKEKFKDVKDE